MTTIHERTVELIPWYVNGTLQANERRAVEEHLSHCLPCRAALRDEGRLGELVRRRAELAPGAGHGISDLLRAIETGETRGDRRRLLAQITWGIGLAAALVVAVFVLPVLLGPGNTVDPAAYSTLTDSRVTEDVRLDIVFADELAETDKEAIIRAAGGRLVAGPTELGRYTIVLDAAARTNIEGVIEALRANPRIRFVGRNFIDADGPAPEPR